LFPISVGGAGIDISFEGVSFEMVEFSEFGCVTMFAPEEF
jgi:hypothetical protein